MDRNEANILVLSDVQKRILNRLDELEEKQKELHRELYYFLHSLIINNSSLRRPGLEWRLERMAKMVLSDKPWRREK